MGRPSGPGITPRRACRYLRIELLEDRATPAVGSVADVFHPMVVAGAYLANPSDTPDQRIDPNTTASPYGGVGSIQVKTRGGSSIGTGVAIDRRHVITAAHVIDLNSDGKFDRKDGTQGVYFIVNYGGDQTSKIGVAKFKIHPDFTGFNVPAVNDDIAILTLARDLPVNVPTYALPLTGIAPGTVLTMVGYGRSGDGIAGYTTSASATIKRVGGNTADAFIGQDDPGRPEVNEVFRFDFDGSDGRGLLGGETLGNTIETTIGPGDSGGPAFAHGEGGLSLVGLNTFTQGADAPRFGSLGGGVILYAYMEFINSVLHPGTGGGLVLPPPPSPGLPPGQVPGATAVSAFVPESVRPAAVRVLFSISSSDEEAKDRTVDTFSPAPEWNNSRRVDDVFVPNTLSANALAFSVDAGLSGLFSGATLTANDE